MTSRLSFFLLFCVLLGTLFFLFTSKPEARTFSVADGALTVTTLAAQDAWLEGEANEEIYMLRSSFASTQSGELRIKSEAGEDRLAYFDETFGMWRPVETTYDEATGELVTTTTKLNARWTTLPEEAVARPNLDAEKDALVSAAPPAAVSFALEIGFADAAGDYVMMEGLGESGGCAGQYRYTGETTVTSDEIVFSDALRYQLVAVWQLAEGCEGLEVIE